MVGSHNTVVVRVQDPIENMASTPFPASQEFRDGYFETTWEFVGPMPRLRMLLDAPVSVLANSWLDWNRGRTVDIPRIGSTGVDWYYVFDGSAIWLALICTALLLRGKRVSNGFSYSRRLCLIVLAGLLLGVEIRELGMLDVRYSNGIVVVITWAILAVAVADKRRSRVIIALSVAALVPFIGLAVAKDLESATIDLLLIWFSIALILLVTVAAWALWGQIRSLIALADLDQGESTWREMYRKLIDCLMISAFMFAIGFPIGEILTAHWIIDRLALNLIWSTGLLFRPPLAWISLLLAISYLANYLISRPRGARIYHPDVVSGTRFDGFAFRIVSSRRYSQ